jgi:hypothetical protein
VRPFQRYGALHVERWLWMLYSKHLTLHAAWVDEEKASWVRYPRQDAQSQLLEAVAVQR